MACSPPQNPAGRKHQTDMRLTINAIFHISPPFEFGREGAGAHAKFFNDKFNQPTLSESFSHLPEDAFECGARDALVSPVWLLMISNSVEQYARSGREPAESDLS